MEPWRRPRTRSRATVSGHDRMANFNRQFLAEVGTTPSAYRRMESSQKPPNEVLSLGLKAAPAAESEEAR